MPQHIDIAEFTRLGKTLTGDISVRDLPRLQDSIIPGEQCLYYELHGSYSPTLQPQIACIIQGSVSLQCQRCLGPFDHELDIRSMLIFVADESLLPAIGDEDESIDYVVAETTLDVSGFIRRSHSFLATRTSTRGGGVYRIGKPWISWQQAVAVRRLG